ncbi:hypothetical protein V493_01387 [Pseudogymnoascus sp. VKM F-4281 (FW-2241)]|nr:hypothetical protein V493_01387 [Pseudogymnoascus sp. VKM F-4281 (FW-2241)]
MHRKPLFTLFTPLLAAVGRLADKAVSIYINKAMDIYLKAMSVPSLLAAPVLSVSSVSQYAHPGYPRACSGCATCCAGTVRNAVGRSVHKGADMCFATIVLQTGICNGIPQPSRSAEVIRDVIIIASVTFPMIALRFFSRRLVSNKLWLDDWAIVVAAILMVPMVVIPIYNATLGFGRHFWDVHPQNVSILRKAFVYAGAAVSIFEDIVIMFLPVFELNALTMSLKKRLILVFMFALGSFACITSIIRLKYIVSYGTTIDLTYANVDPVIWSILETFTAVICASLICLRPLIVKFLPKSFPTTEMSDTGRTPTTSGWAKSMNVKLTSKLRHNSNRFELYSQGGEGLGTSDNAIRIQKSWVTETSPVATPESAEMKGRSSLSTPTTGKNSWDQGL